MIGQQMTAGVMGSGNSLFTDIPHQMQAIAKDIVDPVVPGAQIALYIKMRFVFGDAANRQEIIVPRIMHLQLDQNFELSVFDVLHVSAEVQMSDYLLLEKMYKTLQVITDIYYVNPSGTDMGPSPIMTFLWNAVLVNRGRLSKFITPEQMVDKNSSHIDKYSLLPIEFELYNPDVEVIKSRKTGGIFRNTNVTEMIRILAYHFGIKAIDMEQCQNDMVYENFVIEPLHYLQDIYDYIQKRYGIYQKGMSIYYTGLSSNDSKLYMYPPYEFGPANTSVMETIEILYVGKNNLKSDSFSWKHYATGSTITFEDQTYDVSGTKIICNDITKQFAAADAGSDAIGTISVVFNANTIVDRWRYPKTVTGNLCDPRINKGIVDAMKDGKDFIGYRNLQYNPRYDVSYNNGRTISSLLSMVNCDITELKWYGAMPWTFKPGKLVLFTYGQGLNDVHKVPGLVSSVIYSFNRVRAEVPEANIFTVEATIQLKSFREG